ncbi:unnamed protein product [Brassica rapa subsp. trilocularis]
MRDRRKRDIDKNRGDPLDIFDDTKNLLDLDVVVNCSYERLIVRHHPDLGQIQVYCCGDAQSKG